MSISSKLVFKRSFVLLMVLGLCDVHISCPAHTQAADHQTDPLLVDPFPVRVHPTIRGYLEPSLRSCDRIHVNSQSAIQVLRQLLRYRGVDIPHAFNRARKAGQGCSR